MGYPNPVGLQQVNDELGRPVYEPCNPCDTPTAKSPILDGSLWPVASSPEVGAIHPMSVSGSLKVPVKPVAAATPVVREQPRQESSSRRQSITIHFPHANAGLTPEGKAEIVAFARKVQRNEKLLVRGGTDATGNEALNVPLAQKRAMTVAAELEAAGIARENITTRYCTVSCYVQDNTSESGRQANRRTEVSIQGQR